MKHYVPNFNFCMISCCDLELLLTRFSFAKMLKSEKGIQVYSEESSGKENNKNAQSMAYEC